MERKGKPLKTPCAFVRLFLPLGQTLAVECYRYFTASFARRSSRVTVAAILTGNPLRRALMNRGMWRFRAKLHRYRTSMKLGPETHWLCGRIRADIVVGRRGRSKTSPPAVLSPLVLLWTKRMSAATSTLHLLNSVTIQIVPMETETPTSLPEHWPESTLRVLSERMLFGDEGA